MRFGERQGAEEEEVSINLIPFIDILLVLLIFFVVSTTFLDRSRLEVVLPEASDEVAEEDRRTLHVRIDREGRIQVEDTLLPGSGVEEVRRAIEAEAGGDRQRPVIIEADAQAAHGSVVTVMDALRQLGLTRFGIATRRPEGA